MPLIAVILGTQLLAGGALAAGQPEPQENSLNSAVDNFVSYLKSETNETMTAAARIARENKDSLAQAKSRIDTQIDALRGSLSGQKARLTTLGTEASAMWEAWRETAGTSWAKVEHSARDALDRIAGWMRNQSLSEQRPETPV
ncbi:MAG: hypothetical protein MUO37_14780 [Methyloceanibacter sp.]|nr:hypothetical protein [Methyloceanibacter sp.]